MANILEKYRMYRSGEPLEKLGSHFIVATAVGVVGLALFRKSRFLRTLPLIMATSFSVGYNFSSYREAANRIADSFRSASAHKASQPTTQPRK